MPDDWDLDRILPFELFVVGNAEVHNDRRLRYKSENRFDITTKLWDHTSRDEVRKLTEIRHDYQHFQYIPRSTDFEYRNQEGPTCISTCLAILIQGLSKENEKISIMDVRKNINTQSPRTWSAFLEQKTGYKLAYCNFDRRYVEHYREELKKLDDLFLVSWYSSKGNFGEKRKDSEAVWTGGSHVVIWYRNEIYDTKLDFSSSLRSEDYFSGDRSKKSVKRIFRVVAPWSNHGL